MNDSMWFWLIAAGLVAAFVLFKRLTQISAGEARRLVREGAKLVDVRSPAEFQSGHLQGAINVPVGELAARLSALGPKEQPKVLYCASGARSAMARSVLKRHGYTQVFNLGAMSRW